jgi:hypothetical protein
MACLKWQIIKYNSMNSLIAHVLKNLYKCVDQHLKSQFKYFDSYHDKVFCLYIYIYIYICEEEGEEVDHHSMKGNIYDWLIWKLFSVIIVNQVL